MRTDSKAAGDAASVSVASDADQVTADRAKLPGEAEVADYLRRNPDFFLRHDELLIDLLLPHDSGEAISLLERKVSILDERGIRAREKLHELLQNARNNSDLFKTTQQLVLALIRAESLAECIEATVGHLCGYNSIDSCEFILVAQPGLGTANPLRTTSLADLQQRFFDVFRLQRTHCGRLEPDQLSYLFPDNLRIRSSALCPVFCDGEVVALIALGSHSDTYFNVNLDTLFVDFIGLVIGARISRLLENMTA